MGFLVNLVGKLDVVGRLWWELCSGYELTDISPAPKTLSLLNMPPLRSTSKETSRPRYFSSVSITHVSGSLLRGT